VSLIQIIECRTGGTEELDALLDQWL